MVRLDARLELRLDNETLRRLERRATQERVSVGQLVRDAIARELAADPRSRREAILERALALEVPVPSDPRELAAELDASYKVPASVAPTPPGGARDRGAGAQPRHR